MLELSAQRCLSGHLTYPRMANGSQTVCKSLMQLRFQALSTLNKDLFSLVRRFGPGCRRIHLWGAASAADRRIGPVPLGHPYSSNPGFTARVPEALPRWTSTERQTGPDERSELEDGDAGLVITAKPAILRARKEAAQTPLRQALGVAQG